MPGFPGSFIFNRKAVILSRRRRISLPPPGATPRTQPVLFRPHSNVGCDLSHLYTCRRAASFGISGPTGAKGFGEMQGGIYPTCIPAAAQRPFAFPAPPWPRNVATSKSQRNPWTVSPSLLLAPPGPRNVATGEAQRNPWKRSSLPSSPRQGRWNVATGEAQRNPWKRSSLSPLRPGRGDGM
jgi:hypothetical protein